MSKQTTTTTCSTSTPVRKTPSNSFDEPFCTQNDHFYQDRLGTNPRQESTQKREMHFVQSPAATRRLSCARKILAPGSRRRCQCLTSKTRLPRTRWAARKVRKRIICPRSMCFCCVRKRGSFALTGSGQTHKERCALQGKAPRSSSSFYYANFTATMEAYISNATDINNSVRKQQCFWPSLCLNCKQMTILPRQARDQIQGRFNKRTHTVYAGHRLRGRGWRRLHHL